MSNGNAAVQEVLREAVNGPAVVGQLVDTSSLPLCHSCRSGARLVPLSDYGQEGAAVIYKGWGCVNPNCGFSIRVDKGKIKYGQKLRQEPPE